MKFPILAFYAATALFAFGATGAQAAETYKFDQTHTNIVWSADHFGFSKPSGRFGIVEGTLVLDEEVPANSTVDVVIDVENIVTGIPAFDEHLKSADFLNTAEFPTATFKSTAVEVTGENTAKVTGDLTLHGVTKPVTMDMRLNKLAPSPMTQAKTAGFSGSLVLKRSEFGITTYVPNISDEIEISIEAEANLASAEDAATEGAAE